jgi:NADPH-dependent curcumin reductase CurA
VIDHTREDVAAVLAAEYPRGVDVAYEGVGGDMLCTAMNALAEGGRLLVIGYISGYPVRRAMATLCDACACLLPHAR